MALLIVLSSIVRFVVPSLEDTEWDELNSRLNDQIKNVKEKINSVTSPKDISEVGNELTIVIRQFLYENPTIFESIEIDKSTSKPFIQKKNKTIESIKLEKKRSKRRMYRSDATGDDRKNFWAACRALGDAKRLDTKKNHIKQYPTKKICSEKISGSLVKKH